ncbi:MAG: shikimate dehydrogenase [Clostridia bacterium]|nr:shikimate dehydrogenase [Clostridia bacterium]
MEINSFVSGRTKVMGLVGNPVEHSISPFLHNTISSVTGIDAVYVAFKVEKESLCDAVKGLKALNVLGFNVTVPYKKEIMKYLDENSKEALLMGAVNTVKNIDGRLYGYNTDAEGFSRSFKEEAGTGFKGKSVFIIGAGGTSRAIAVKIAAEGAKRVCIANRTAEKAIDISDMINSNVNSVARGLGLYEEETKNVFRDCEIIINTTSAGMFPDIGGSPVDNTFEFSKGQIVYDVIYNPPKTRFLEEAEKNNCKTINGTGMLFYQAVYAYEIWTGLKLGDEFLAELYASFKNILLKK